MFWCHIHFLLVALIRALVVCLTGSLITACAGYMPGEKAYWDKQVENLCNKDGGITVYERVTLSAEELKLIQGSTGGVLIPSKQAAGAETPYYLETEQTAIRDGSPRVWRDEMRIVRRADGKVLARRIGYTRFGGDFPGLSHDSSFACQDLGFRGDLTRETFAIPPAQ